MSQGNFEDLIEEYQTLHNITLDPMNKNLTYDLQQEVSFNASSLLEAKKIGKMIEMDNQMMANRINLLKHKEYKTIKEVRIVKRSMRQMEWSRTNTERRKKEQQLVKDQRQQLLQRNQSHIIQLREERRIGKGQLKLALFKRKKTLADQVKAQNNDNLYFLQQEHNQSAVLNNEQARRIKTSEIQARLKRQSRMERVKDMAQREHFFRKELIDRWRYNRKKELLQMELLEIDLTKNLQNTQQMQRLQMQQIEKQLKIPKKKGNKHAFKDLA